MERNIAVEQITQTPTHKREIEIVERKGIGHPDSVSDGIAESVSRALSKYYLKEYGKILHHNTDQVGGFRRTKKAKAILQDLQRTFPINAFASFGLVLEQGKNQLLLAHTIGAFNFEFGGHVHQLGDMVGFKIGKMHGSGIGKGNDSVDVHWEPRRSEVQSEFGERGVEPFCATRVISGAQNNAFRGDCQ